MALRILLVEDNPYKQSRIMEVLRSSPRDVEIATAMSFTSARQAIERSDYKMIVLDVSLPTYDRTATESGGKLRILGGREIARQLSREDISTQIVFLTQYSSFSDKGTSYTFESLSEQLARDCGNNFAGMFFFDPSSLLWKESLQSLILKLDETDRL